RRRAVNDAGNGAAMFRLDHEHVAAVPLRDDLILEVFRSALSTEERLERAAQPCPLLPQAIANAFQLRARVLGDLARRIDLVADLRSFASKRRRAGACRLE